MIPDLPKANYRVWVRGYGLVNSPKVAAEPGKTLNLTAVIAPSLAAAAQYYPAIYWASMIRVPDESRFPGTGADGNGIAGELQDPGSMAQSRQDQRLRQLPSARQLRDAQHPEGARPFRLLDRRLGAPLQSGPAGRDMVRFVAQLIRPTAVSSPRLADWTDRIKAGELPSATPPRPSGVERNIVVTVRDWSDPKHYLHDLALTDKRKPTVNGNGLIYGAAELSHRQSSDPRSRATIPRPP